MNRFLDKVIDLWVKNFDDNSNDKINVAYKSITSVATVYNVINKYSYNMYVINHMWEDLQDVITDEDKLEIILLLKLVINSLVAPVLLEFLLTGLTDII